MLKLYFKLQLLFRYLCNLIKTTKFAWCVYKSGSFLYNQPIMILKVIKEFIEIEASNYSDSVILSRDVSTSKKLILTLIDMYFENKSEKTLNQILEVLKVDFIQREDKNV